MYIGARVAAVTGIHPATAYRTDGVQEAPPMQHRHCLTLTLICFLSTACGANKGTGPSSANPLTGTWTGTIQELTIANVGPGTVRVTLSQSGSSLSGNWSSSYAVSAYNNSGAVTGTVNGASVNVTIAPSVPTACPSRITATANGRSLTGTYAAFNCSVPSGGTVNLVQQ